MTLAAPSTPAFTGRPSLLRAAASARRARAAHRRGALVVVAGKKGAKAKNKDSGRSIHFRQGPERFNAGGVGEVARGGKGRGGSARHAGAVTSSPQAGPGKSIEKDNLLRSQCGAV